MKNKLLSVILCLGLLTAYFSCEKDDGNPLKSESATEEQIISYGVDKSAILNSKTFGNVSAKLANMKQNSVSNRSDSLAISLTPTELLDRLDLDKAYFNSDSIYEVFDAPIKTWGSYGRIFRSLTKGNLTQSYLLTYPDSTDHKLFYVSTLDGILLQKVEIQNDGYAVETKYNSLSSIQTSTTGRVDTCTETNYNYCKQGIHSFNNFSNNVWDCIYWNSPNASGAPSVFTVEYPCPGDSETSDPGAGGGFSSPPPRNPGGAGGGGFGDSDGDGYDDLQFYECQILLDCADCNLPGDLNNDCAINETDTCISNGNSPEVCECVENGGALEECTDFENNCMQIAAQLVNNDFSNKIAFLETKTGETQETGFMQIANSTFVNIPVVNGGHSLDLPEPLPTNMMGFLHTHIDSYEIPDENGDGIPEIVEPIKMFSPKDINMFLKILVNANNNNIPIADVFATMVSSSGNYTLRFNGDVNAVNANFNPAALKKTFISYFRRYSRKEKAFLNFLKNEISAEGTSLYKIMDNGTIKRKFLKQNGSVNSENCQD